MSSYNHQEFDFINRTKKIIEQYKNLDLPKEEKFEVTLLINCLVGLLIIPKEHWYEILPTSIVTKKEWGIDEDEISVIKKGQTKNVKDVATHLRNSIAHYRFKVFNSQFGDINSVNFEDKDKGSLTFQATIPISGIIQFTTKLTETLLDEMNRAQKYL